MGAGRFARIGIPTPEVMGPFVGGVEIICGGMLLLGLLTRLAAVPLLVDIFRAQCPSAGSIRIAVMKTSPKCASGERN
jgi:putative oxidoreductase